MKSIVKKIGVSAFLFAPVLAFASFTGAASTAKSIIGTVTQIVVALAFIYFLWGLMKYLLGDAESKAESKSAMIYSLLLMFVMFSIWGLVGLLNDFVGINSNAAPSVNIPTVNN